MLLFSPKAVSFAVVRRRRQLSLSIRSVGTKVPPRPQAGFTLPRPPSPFPVVRVPTPLRRAGRRARALACCVSAPAARAPTRRRWRGVPAPPCTLPLAPAEPWGCVPLCFPSVHLSVLARPSCLCAHMLVCLHALHEALLPCTFSSSSSACGNPYKLFFKRENDSCLLPKKKIEKANETQIKPPTYPVCIHQTFCHL